MHVSSPLEAEETIDKSVLIDLGLIIGKDARRRRDIRTKTTYWSLKWQTIAKKLNAFGYTEQDVREALLDDERREK